MIMFCILFLLAYLAGSLCSAIVVSHAFNLPDPRAHGSKNPGTTNVLRLAGKPYAVLVLLADVLKGTLPLLLGQWLALSAFELGRVALAAVLGHLYPVFFNFKGGKGVATTLGALLGLNPWLGLFTALTWLIVAALSRYSSLAAIIALNLAPVYVLLGPEKTAFFPLLTIALLILWQHRSNIQRLIHGEEPKIKLKR